MTQVKLLMFLSFVEYLSSMADGGESGLLCSRGVPVSGFPPVLVNGLAYVSALCTYFVAANIHILPILPYPLIGCLLPWNLQVGWLGAIIILMAMWGCHFARRFWEVMLVHDYQRTMPVCESIGAVLYYGLFGFIIGWSMNRFDGYQAPHTSLVALGLMLFIGGQMGNCQAHLALKAMRISQTQYPTASEPVNGRSLPKGMLFNYVSCPHYLFEIITWIGYALCCFTLASFLFLTTSTITLFIYAYRRHKRYVEEFDGKEGRELYPPNRKALIPFIF